MIKKFFGKGEKPEDNTPAAQEPIKPHTGRSLEGLITEGKDWERYEKMYDQWRGNQRRLQRNQALGASGLGSTLGAAAAIYGKTADMTIYDEVSTPEVTASDPIRDKIKDKVTDLRASGGMQNSQIADILEELLNE